MLNRAEGPVLSGGEGIGTLERLDFAGKRVTVVGLGVEGLDLARFLARRGADVTVSDSRPAERLGERVSEVRRLGAGMALASKQVEELMNAEAIFVSQGVPLELPGIEAARDRGVPLFSMMQLFLELCPGPVVGITGSSGKTTTTALVAAMFEADERPFFVGGNIGVGLLDHLADIRPYTWSVLEVSHTQLQLTPRSPHVAAVLNITPNHLDRFDWETYLNLKASIIRYQAPGDVAVLGYDDPEARPLEAMVSGGLLWFSMTDDVPGDGVFVRDRHAFLRCGGLEERLFSLDDVRLRGEHNRHNAVAASAVAAACGISPEAIACAVATFTGVRHRLELVAEADGVRYYDDSIATTPERTIAGLRSFEEPIVLLLGGRDKHLPLDDMVRETAARCRAVVFFGESGRKFAAAFKADPSVNCQLSTVNSLDDAVAAASAAARPGDIVLLSPAGTSFDAYENFEERGAHFRSLVRALCSAAPSGAEGPALSGAEGEA